MCAMLPQPRFFTRSARAGVCTLRVELDPDLLTALVACSRLLQASSNSFAQAVSPTPPPRGKGSTRPTESSAEKGRWTILDWGDAYETALYVQSLMTCDRAVLVMRTSGEQKRQKVQ